MMWSEYRSKKKRNKYAAKENDVWFLFQLVKKEIGCKFLILYDCADDLWGDILFRLPLNTSEQIWMLFLTATDAS